jgi:hypothetical protein
MPHSGLDTARFPGFDTMAAARKLGFVVSGYYLRAPSHPDQSWSGKRSGLAQLGFGFLPVYVGQQLDGPGSHQVTDEQGQVDGAEAALLMHDEGFPPGSTVFLDLENGPPLGARQAAYVYAWRRAVISADMVAGVYVSHALAHLVALQNPGAPIWTVNVPTVKQTAGAPPFPAPSIGLGGFSQAAAWQYRQNVSVAALGGLLVDLNSAATPDPSAPIPARQT